MSREPNLIEIESGTVGRDLKVILDGTELRGVKFISSTADKDADLPIVHLELKGQVRARGFVEEHRAR